MPRRTRHWRRAARKARSCAPRLYVSADHRALVLPQQPRGDGRAGLLNCRRIPAAWQRKAHRFMRLSAYPIANLKEVRAEADVVSHQLMLRAGLIRRLAAGLYTWLPMGLRTLRKIETIVREEMNRAGALEVLMPTVQPAE